MPFIRLAAILAAITIGACTLLFLLTRDRKYFRFAVQVLQYAVLFALAVLSLFALERVVSLLR